MLDSMAVIATGKALLGKRKCYLSLGKQEPHKVVEKGIPLYPNLVNLKSNTMKNTAANVVLSDIRRNFFAYFFRKALILRCWKRKAKCI